MLYSLIRLYLFFFLFDWKRKICWLMYLKLGNKVWFRQRLIFCCTTVVAGEHFSHKSSRQFPVKLSNLPADNGLYFFICMFFIFCIYVLLYFEFWPQIKPPDLGEIERTPAELYLCIFVFLYSYTFVFWPQIKQVVPSEIEQFACRLWFVKRRGY